MHFDRMNAQKYEKPIESNQDSVILKSHSQKSFRVIPDQTHRKLNGLSTLNTYNLDPRTNVSGKGIDLKKLVFEVCLCSRDPERTLADEHPAFNGILSSMATLLGAQNRACAFQIILSRAKSYLRSRFFHKFQPQLQLPQFLQACKANCSGRQILLSRTTMHI